MNKPGSRASATPGLAALIVTSVVTACGSSDTPAAESPLPPPPAPSLEGKPGLCAHPGSDVVRTLFCEGDDPPISSLADLQSLLRIGSDPYGGGYSTGPTPVLLAHSTALAGRFVSVINPRIILGGGGGAGLTMAFQRGAQQVEMLVRDRDDSRLNFYLLSFRKACNDLPGGCLPGDLYTPAIESGWTNIRLEDDEDLKNTPSDCRQCHQRAREESILLMRELEAPWTHFFGSNLNPLIGTYKYGIDGGLLTSQYREAKEGESYGNSPADGSDGFGGFTLESLVAKPQALFFDSTKIMDERFTRAVDSWPGEPTRSPTWDAAYESFKRGEQLALPYFDAVVTDPTKLAALTSAYRSFVAGTLPAAELPDLSDIFSDDPQTRAEIGLETEPDATPAEALVQACGACHNDALDQSLSRARFNVGLSRMNQAEIEEALDRLARSTDESGAMPPRDTRRLTPAVRARLVDYLRSNSFPEADLAFLDHAATSGMTGGEQARASALPPPGYDDDDDTP